MNRCLFARLIDEEALSNTGEITTAQLKYTADIILLNIASAWYYKH